MALTLDSDMENILRDMSTPSLSGHGYVVGLVLAVQNLRDENLGLKQQIEVMTRLAPQTGVNPSYGTTVSIGSNQKSST